MIELLNGIPTWALVLGILGFTILLAQLASYALERFLQRSDLSQYRFLKHFISALIYLAGLGTAVYLIEPLRTLSVSLFAGAGVLAIIAGFASQHALSNVVSGIFIAVFKPFRIGDAVKIRDTITGIVEDINLRHTVIKTFENKRIIIPNSTMTGEIIENASIGDARICRYVDFPISYDSDLDKAMKIMQDECAKHPDAIETRTKKEILEKKPKISVRLIGFGDSAMNLRAWVWAKDAKTAFILGCDLNKSIKKRFDKAKIEIPYPHRTIIYKSKRRR